MQMVHIIFKVCICINNFFKYNPPCLGVGVYSNAYFGQGTGPIFRDNVRCSGSETKLISCSYSTPTFSDDHSKDAGIRCTPGEFEFTVYLLTFTLFLAKTASCRDGDVKLVGSWSTYLGRVEVCLSQRWGTVTDDGWSTVDARVVCRQLGYNALGTFLL